jgi:hypothetical protein
MRKTFTLAGPVDNIRVYNGGGARIMFDDDDGERCSEALAEVLREVALADQLSLLLVTPRLYAVIDQREGVVIRLLNLPPEDMGSCLLPATFNRFRRP